MELQKRQDFKIKKIQGLPAMKYGNVYLYQNNVVIPSLAMQDDTLGIN